MILAANHIEKYFTDQCILKDATFHVNDHERVALVGSNGSGKTTLLRILVGELPADSGEVTTGKDVSVGYLPQQQSYNSDKTIYEELLQVKEHILQLDQEIRQLEQEMKHMKDNDLERALSRYSLLQTEFEKQDGYAYKSQVMGIINGLGFAGNDAKQPIQTLSGGQKTRVALGKLLLMEPDLLILDEPTNHLDLDSIRWLESYLLNYKGSVLIVSHDRYFLDRITNKVVEISYGDVTTFQGNYSDYAVKKEALRTARMNQYLNQQREIKHQEAVIEKLRSFNREKSIRRAESRIKQLDKIDRIEKPMEETRTMNFMLTPWQTSGNDVLTIENYSKHFDSITLFEQIGFEIKRGEKAAILGKNGTGKTTLLKMIAGLIESDTGTCRLGTNVSIGYYDQEHQVLSMEKTIFDEIHDDYPHLNHTEIRNVLAAFLFTGDDVFKTIRQLSGGEKGRVSLAKLMLSEANFLLLDEPTNHLDIESKEILEEAINNYTGTVLYVSHDRYFINKTATRILDLTNQTLLSYDGNYTYYLDKKDTVESRYLKITRENNKSDYIKESKNDWQQQKQEQAQKRKLEKLFEQTEQDIECLESEISSLDIQITLPENASNVSKLIELGNEKEMLEKKLRETIDLWEELAEKIF